jgi:hypothetical protein
MVHSCCKAWTGHARCCTLMQHTCSHLHQSQGPCLKHSGTSLRPLYKFISKHDAHWCTCNWCRHLGGGVGGGADTARIMPPSLAHPTSPPALTFQSWPNCIPCCVLCCCVVLCADTPGTKINWSGAIRPPHHVREEWASTYGLAHLGPESAAFDNALDTVCAKLGVSTGTTMSKPNVILQEGMKALGQHVEE